MINLLIFDNNHFQYQAELLPEESWSSLRVRLKDFLRGNPFAREIIKQRPDRYRASYVQLCIGLIVEIESENETTE